MSIRVYYIPYKKKVSKKQNKRILELEKSLIKISYFIGANMVTVSSILANELDHAYINVDKGGTALYEMCIHIGYWICIICCAIQVIKRSMDGDVASILNIVLKYVTIYASMFGIKWFLDIVTMTFNTAPTATSVALP